MSVNYGMSYRCKKCLIPGKPFSENGKSGYRCPSCGREYVQFENVTFTNNNHGAVKFELANTDNYF